MAARPRPTARRIELGHELRLLRQRAKLTLQQAVKGMSLSDTKLYRIETGLHDLRSAGDLRKLLERYGIEDDEAVERLLAIQREGASQEWWVQFKGNMPSGMPRFIGVESVAREIRAYHPALVLGLLQTEAYARALYELSKPIEETTTEFIEQNVAVRMERKAALTREDEPLRLWVVLYEPALRYVVGGAKTMREQYEEIIRLASLDHVTVQVLPQSVRGYLAQHDFSILLLDDYLPSMVHVDNAWGAASVSDKPREVGRFSRRFEALSRSAKPSEETPTFLHRLSREVSE